LAGTIPIKGIPYLYENTRIIAAIHNAFGTRLSSDNDEEHIADELNKNINKPNHLQMIIEKYNLTKKSSLFHKLDHTQLPEFPQINPFELKKLSGQYQLELAKSYYADHQFNGIYKFSVMKELQKIDYAKHGITVIKPLLVKAKMESRHSKSKAYAMFVLCDLNNSGADTIIGFYCQCRNGARTVGCCAHTMSLIWFLGYGRYAAQLKTPSEFLNRHFPQGIPPGDSDDKLEANDELI
jgi:hypothetical protein